MYLSRHLILNDDISVSVLIQQKDWRFFLVVLRCLGRALLNLLDLYHR